MKYLVIAAVIAIVVFWLLRTGKDKSRRAPEPPARRKSASASSAAATETMLGCAECGTFVPASEALMLGRQAFCCEEHRRRHVPS